MPIRLPEGREALARTSERFETIFRRKAGTHDNPDPETYVVSPDDLLDAFEKAGTEVGIDPAVLHAIRKTGRIVLSTMRDIVPQKALEEWDEAVAEYDRVKDQPLPWAVQTVLQSRRELREEFDRLPYILGKMAKDCAATDRHVIKHPVAQFRRAFVFFAVARAAKTLRALDHLVKHNLGEDALSLVRSLYENYLYMVVALLAPEALRTLTEAQAGLLAGTHRHPLNKQGKPNRRVIEEIRSGRLVRSDVTTFELAQHSPFEADALIQRSLYSFLSQFTHPHVITAQHYMDKDGYTTTGRDWVDEALVLALAMGGLVLDAMLQIQPLHDSCRRDAATFLKHARTTLLRALDLAFEDNDATQAFKQRIAVLGHTWPQHEITIRTQP